MKQRTRSDEAVGKGFEDLKAWHMTWGEKLSAR